MTGFNGGRWEPVINSILLRLSMPHYIKALAAASEDSQLDVFERIGQLGEAIKPRSNVFIPPPVCVHIKN